MGVMGRNKKDIRRINKTGQWTFDKIVKGIAVMLIVIVFIVIFNSTAREGIEKLLGIQLPGSIQLKEQPLTNYDFYNTFVEEYQACKLSDDFDCRCPITSLEGRLPVGYVINLFEKENNVEIYLFKYEGFEKTEAATTAVMKGYEKDNSAELKAIKNDRLFSNKIKEAKWGKRDDYKYLKRDELDDVSRILIFRIQDEKKVLYGSSPGTYIEAYATLSPEFLVHSVGRKFSNFIYKLSKSDTAFVAENLLKPEQKVWWNLFSFYSPSELWNSMRQCSVPEALKETILKFESIVEDIADFYSEGETTKEIEIGFAEKYSLKQENAELILYYMTNEIKRSATQLCPTNKELPNGNYALTKDHSDVGSTCVEAEKQTVN